MKTDKKKLSGVRVAILVADGFEQIEVTRPMRALRRAGADVRIVSLRPGRIRGMNLMWRGVKLPVDDTVAVARPEDYGAVLLPGGFVNPDLLRQSEDARTFVTRFHELGRPLAVICHGPELLISAGLTKGRRMTSWPGIADDVRNSGATWEDSEVVRDGTWISSRGPQDLPVFTSAMIDLFAEQAPRATERLRRRVHWAAHLSRAATVAGAAGVVIGVRAAYRAASGSALLPVLPRRPRATAEVVRDLGLGAAFGGMLFAKLALDPAVKVLPDQEDRGRVVVAAWRRFVIPSGVALAAATAGWLGARRQMNAGSLRTATDLLLAGAVATGAINALSGGLLSRAEKTNGVPLEDGRTGAPQLPREDDKALRTGAVTGYAHAGLLAATIGAASALRARTR